MPIRRRRESVARKPRCDGEVHMARSQIQMKIQLFSNTYELKEEELLFDVDTPSEKSWKTFLPNACESLGAGSVGNIHSAGQGRDKPPLRANCL